MAGIDDRARGLNERLAADDDDFQTSAEAQRAEEQAYARKAGRGRLPGRPRRPDLRDAYDEGLADADAEDAEAADEEDEDEDQADEDEEDAGPQVGPRTQAAREGAPALSAGLVLGLIAYSAVLQLFKGGPAQLNGWIKAKLINEPWGPAAAAGGG